MNEYKARLKEFAEYLEQQNLPLKSVKNEDLSTFSKTLFEKCQKTSTIRSKLSAFHVFNIWAVNKNYMSTVVITPNDYPKTPNQRIRRLTDEELAIFKSYIDNLQENIRMAFYLMLNSGCRVGEAANLRVEDVTLRGKTIFIDIKDAKWGSDRCIPVIDEQIGKIIWEIQEPELEVDNRPLFRVSKRTLQNYATKFFQRNRNRLPLPLTETYFAAILTEKGVPLTTVQFLLGHKSLGMTAHYAKIRISRPVRSNKHRNIRKR